MKRNFVVDSSVVVKWLNSIDELHLENADRLLKDCEGGKVLLMAPSLFKYEVGNALLFKGLGVSEYKAALVSLAQLPILSVEIDSDDLADCGQIAHNYSMTFYDSAYVLLAKKNKAQLITANTKHQGRPKEVGVIDLKDY